MLPCPVMLDNSSRPTQRADAVVLFFSQRLLDTASAPHSWVLARVVSVS